MIRPKTIKVDLNFIFYFQEWKALAQELMRIRNANTVKIFHLVSASHCKVYIGNSITLKGTSRRKFQFFIASVTFLCPLENFRQYFGFVLIWQFFPHEPEDMW